MFKYIEFIQSTLVEIIYIYSLSTGFGTQSIFQVFEYKEKFYLYNNVKKTQMPIQIFINI